MGDQFDFPFEDEPLEEEEHGAARWSDPPTSHEAAEAVNPVTIYGKISDTLYNARNGSVYDPDQGLITHEISELSGIDYQTVTPRMVKMEEKGWVYRTGRTRAWIGSRKTKRTSKQSIVWNLTSLRESAKSAPSPIPQLPLIPPGLAQEMLGVCAECGQDEWVHHAYWREAFIGADHEFRLKERP